MTIAEYTKDAADKYNFTFDFAEWLIAGSGETISSFVTEAEAGVTLVDISDDTTSVTVRIEGGTLGETYRVSCTITTSASQVNKESFDLTIEEQ